ncbi:hypothetical protein [Haliangium ochraceum]|uniref:Lipoprotein n=1 Tax=Haliangium ochraceum (strain DSM 14365 / JCM 11303 / SMP-2) TaxID=502025 RepID=D0LTB1_HALO1|nr:hypothetical protein [Haliangium ochraceum]ACY13806.1 hypothetical protein Hoch_1245 [Haliangium ochraceum DSM 14365]
MLHRIYPSQQFSSTSPYRSLGVGLLGFLFAFVSACGDNSEVPPAQLQLSYEAIPGLGVALDQGTIDTSPSSYAERDEFTREIFDDLIPEVMAAVDIDIVTTESELAPGGFLFETNPAMQTRIDADADADAERLAAALGYVMYQWSVLITDFDDDQGATGYVVVRFTEAALTAERAQAFFLHASEVDVGLGGGYSAFGDDMIFLNVLDSEGTPFSGLNDDEFQSGLEQAASTFADTSVNVVEVGTAAARFVENDWDMDPDGAGYLSRLNGVDMEALEQLQGDFEARIATAAERYGWDVGTPEQIASGRGVLRGALRELEALRPLSADGQDALIQE